MDKKDIIILSFVLVFGGISLYQRYTKKKKRGQAGDKKPLISKGSLAGQPDDYEPYSKQ